MGDQASKPSWTPRGAHRATLTELVLYSEVRSSFHRRIGTCAPILVTFVFFIVRKYDLPAECNDTGIFVLVN